MRQLSSLSNDELHTRYQKLQYKLASKPKVDSSGKAIRPIVWITPGNRQELKTQMQSISLELKRRGKLTRAWMRGHPIETEEIKVKYEIGNEDIGEE